MANSFYDVDELSSLAFKSIGKNVRISRFARFYGQENIEIGNNVRIDDFCILSGTIKIGNNIHISAFCALYGNAGIEMFDFSGLSPRSTIFSAIDDFSGDHLIGPIHPESKIKLRSGKVICEKYTQIGANCVVMPGVKIKEGSIAGAMSFINKDLECWTINCGIPVRFIKSRKRELLNLIY